MNTTHNNDSQLPQSPLHVLVHLHDCGLVAAAIAVVRRGEDGTDVVVVSPQVALSVTSFAKTHFHAHLVCAGNEVQIVHFTELGRDVLFLTPSVLPHATERVASAT